MKYWLNTISLERLQIGIAGGFTQANHGRAMNLARLAQGDLIAFYSPRTRMEDGEPLQPFTAIGRVNDEQPYQVEMTPTFHPWRRSVDFLSSEAVPIRPLIDALDFIEDKRHWGFPFRRGLFEISGKDFQRIAAAMHSEID